MKKSFQSKKEMNFIRYFQKTDFGKFLKAGNLRKVDFRLKKQDKMISLRLSSDLLDEIKQEAGKWKTPYQKLIRTILENHVSRR